MTVTRNESAAAKHSDANPAPKAPRSQRSGRTPAGTQETESDQRAAVANAKALVAEAVEDQSWHLRIPGVGVTMTLEHPERAAFYAGLAALALIEVIDWPVAALICAGHSIAHRAHNRALRGIAEGLEAGV
jgi:hypothetical protein